MNSFHFKMCFNGICWWDFMGSFRRRLIRYDSLGNINSQHMCLCLYNITSMLFSISLQIWIDRSKKEEKGKNKKLEDMLLNRRGVCDILLNNNVCVEFLLLLCRLLAKCKPTTRFSSLIWIFLSLPGRSFL